VPDNAGGTFDVSNGFFEHEDEGTGGGLYTGQLALFRTNDGKDIIAINGFSFDAVVFNNIIFFISSHTTNPYRFFIN
jgi:hypothetical protein